MNYIKENMIDALKDHVLEKQSETHYLMRRQNTGTYHIHIAEVGSHLVLTGDLMIGDGNGIVSAGGYGIPWFCQPKSIDYLCEKFFRKDVWEWERALEYIDDWIERPEEYGLNENQIMEIKELKDVHYYWPHGDPTSSDFYDALYEIDPYLCDDGVPGYGIPTIAAGWLGAVNNRFSQLWKELHS